MHKIAEIMYGEEFEVIPYIEEKPPEGVNEKIWYCGQSALKLAEADYFIGVYNQRCNYIDNNYEYCEFEEHLARNNGIPTRTINCRNYICFEDLKRK